MTPREQILFVLLVGLCAIAARATNGASILVALIVLALAYRWSSSDLRNR